MPYFVNSPVCMCVMNSNSSYKEKYKEKSIRRKVKDMLKKKKNEMVKQHHEMDWQKICSDTGAGQ